MDVLLKGLRRVLTGQAPELTWERMSNRQRILLYFREANVLKIEFRVDLLHFEVFADGHKGDMKSFIYPFKDSSDLYTKVEIFWKILAPLGWLSTTFEDGKYFAYHREVLPEDEIRDKVKSGNAINAALPPAPALDENEEG